MARGSSSNSQRAKLRRVHALIARDPDRRPRALGRCEDPAERDRHAVVGGEVAQHRARSPRRSARVRRAGGEDGVGGERAGEQRLADALAGHGGRWPRPRRRRTAPAAAVSGDARRCGRGSARPCAGASATGAGPSTAGMCGRCEQLGPQLLHVLAVRARRPRWMPKPTLARPSGERERPGVARQQVGLEPHAQLARRGRARRRRSTGGTRATRRGSRARPAPRRLRSGDHMPSAPIDVAGAAPCRRPSTSSTTRSASLRAPRERRGRRAPLAPASRARSTQRGVEVGAAGDGGVDCPWPRGQRERRPASRRRAHHDVVDRLPRRHGAGSRPSASSRRSAPVGEPVAAALVAGERGLVDERDVARPGEGDRRRAPGGPAPTTATSTSTAGHAHAARVEALRRPVTFAGASPWRAPAARRDRCTPGARR